MPTKKTTYQKIKEYGGGLPYKLGSGAMTGMTILEVGKNLLGLKHGGRVKGVGKATHGHGKAMKKQGKK